MRYGMPIIIVLATVQPIKNKGSQYIAMQLTYYHWWMQNIHVS